jgi:ornithine cyclodeaminase/alanine dehydrogenase-like protein (mu-crystallin family)
MSIRVFSASEVRKALPMKEAIRAMKEVYRDLSSGSVFVPPRTRLNIAAHDADALVMPSYSPLLNRLGVKIITLHPENPTRGLPFIQALMMLLDAATGMPLAVMNGSALTAIRTGAASGAATDVLARPDASRVAIFGAGAQAETQLEAVCAVRPIRLARVFDVSLERVRAFAARMSEALRIEVVAASSPAAALADADVVCTATTAEIPVFADADLAPGAHINAIGSYKPPVRGNPSETGARARGGGGRIEAAWGEGGGLVMAREEGAVTAAPPLLGIGQDIARDRAGRESDAQITFFKSVGIASQDLAAADVVLKNGVATGLGTSVSL